MSWFFMFGLGAFFMFFDYSYIFFFMVGVLWVLLCGWGGFSFSGMFFVDSVSFFLIFLCCLIFFFCFLSMFLDLWGSNSFGSFFLCLGGIFFMLFLSFSCFNHIFFYASFELTFVLMFFFLYGWGYSPERVSASFYMIFYTLVVSFPFLVFLASLPVLSFSFGSFLFWGEGAFYWWLGLIFVFLVKLPVYGVHLWLPKAHVEAPVSGSMVLAGMLLKLGVYGIFRFSPVVLGGFAFVKGCVVSVGLVGGLWSCFLCLRQSDMKAFVAYSSVCHMGLGLGGLCSGSFLGLSGSVFMMIGHGFCSSCLFYILYVFYERFFTRSGLVLKGVGYLCPLALLIWFMFAVFNMGVPPSFSFFSEVALLTGLGGLSLHVFIIVGPLLLLSGFYGIYLYVVSCHSVSFLGGWGVTLSGREFLNFYGHGFFMIFIILSLEFFYL